MPKAAKNKIKEQNCESQKAEKQKQKSSEALTFLIKVVFGVQYVATSATDT